MVKRIFKIFGICIALLVIVGGIGVGIYALTGGFNKVVIDITRLYIDDKTIADKEIYTLGDVTTMISCEPLNATSKELEVIVSDPLRVVDEKGNLVKEGILKNVPKTVTAGKEFKLEVNKDSMGNNIGGVATLTFRPADKDKVITDFTLKVIVDVAIPNNSLYFAGNDSDVLTTTGKNITMGLSNNPQNVYLKSNLINAFFLETSKGNLKQAEISYVYKNLKGEIIDQKTFKDLEYKRNFNADTKEYNYYYEVPFTPNTPGNISVSAKMHRTNEIEKAYNEGKFDNVPQFTVNSNEFQMFLDRYNSFINKYIQFFDVSNESYDFFKSFLTADGKVRLTTAQQIEDSKKFIFQTCTTNITVTPVNLSGITSIESPKSYRVFDSSTLSLDDLITEYELNVTLDKDEVANVEIEKKSLFTSLKVSPYVYVEKSEYLTNKEILWTDYKTIYGVHSFENNKPLEVTEEPLTSEEIEPFTGLGYLLLLERSDTAYEDYISISTPSDLSVKSWTFNFNVPMRDENNDNISVASKALFLKFEVTGRDVEKNTAIVRNTYSRIYINYDEYDFVDKDNGRMILVDEHGNSIKRMAINKEIRNVTTDNYSEIIYKQYIKTNLNSAEVDNYSSVPYKSIMYFVEKRSNQIDGGGPKVATVGEYNFKYMNSNREDPMVKLFGGTDNLIGQRLLNEGTRENPEYYIHAINASTEDDPIKIFAVVYLSDKDGNPIDVNGRIIKVNEDISGDPTTIVVFAITDISENGMQKVHIDSFIENINYYTESKVDVRVEDTHIVDGEEVIGEYTATSGYVKRNHINSYIDNTNNEFGSQALKELQDLLTLKLLYRNKFELIVTNFELDSSGLPSGDIDQDGEVLISTTDFNGKPLENQVYIVNTIRNKQLAINKMCDADFENNFKLFVDATNLDSIKSHEILKDESSGDVLGIKYTIFAEDKSGSANYICFKTTDTSTAINSLDYSRDFVQWKVSKYEISDWLTMTNKTPSADPNLEDASFEPYVKLYSRYSQNYTSADNNQEFGRVNLQASGLEFTKYYLFDGFEKDYYKNPRAEIEDNFDFSWDEEGIRTYNEDIIDMSQAVAKASDDTEINANTGDFPDILSYMLYYRKFDLDVQYTSPYAIYQLTEDLIFTDQNDLYIYVADKKYHLYMDSEEYIYINGQKQYLTDGKLIVRAGTFVPAINQDTVMILGEEFKIYKDANQNIYINSIVTNNTYQKTAKLLMTNYNPSQYLSNQALLQESDNGELKTYVNFTKGGLLENNGFSVFVKDGNGKYKIVVCGDNDPAENRYTQSGVDNNGNIQYIQDPKGIYKFEICDAFEPAENRYSKKGVPVFLVMNINGQSFKQPVTQVIEYELVQEEISLEVIDSNGNAFDLPEGNSSQTLNINAGTTTDIKLKVGEKVANSINLVGASFENTFYQYCTFTLDDNQKITFSNGQNRVEAGLDIQNILIDIMDMYQSTTGTLKITYPHQGKTVTKTISLGVDANFKFNTITGSDVEAPVGENYYQIELNANSNNSIETIVRKYFESDQTISLSLKESNPFAQISGDNLKVGESYAVVDPNADINASSLSIPRDSIEFTITLNNGSKTLTVDKMLKIMINPSYTFDFRGVKNISILNSQSLLSSSNYIKVYEGYSNISNAIPETPATIASLFNIYDNGTLCTNGIITSDTWYQDQVKNLAIKYNVGIDSATTKEFKFSLTVKGFEVYFSEDGSFDTEKFRVDTYDEIGKEDYFENIATYFPTTINLNIFQGRTLDLNKHFAPFIKQNDPVLHVNGKGEFVNSPISLYVGLKNSAGKVFFNELQFEDETLTHGQYTIVIAKQPSKDDIIAEIDRPINVNKIELFYDESAGMMSNVYFDCTSNTTRVTENIVIEGVIDSTVNIANYIKLFNNQTGHDYIINDGTQTVGSDLTVGSTEMSYNIYYQVGDKVYDTGIDILLKPTTSASE